MATGWTRIADSSDIQAILNAIAALKTVVDGFRGAYTDARAINLDKLDAYVSSRADKATTDYLKGQIGDTTHSWESGWEGGGSIQAKLNRLMHFTNHGGSLAYINDYISTKANQVNVGVGTDTGAWTGAQYNENLHQKCADIMSWVYSTLTNTNAMLAKGLPGDYVGKTLNFQKQRIEPRQSWILSHPKGGLAIIQADYSDSLFDHHTLIVDGVTWYTAQRTAWQWRHISIGAKSGLYEIIIPFNSYIQITSTEDPPVASNSVGIQITSHAYLNP